jgi:hypothetical protein
LLILALDACAAQARQRRVVAERGRRFGDAARRAQVLFDGADFVGGRLPAAPRTCLGREANRGHSRRGLAGRSEPTLATLADERTL